MNACNVCKHKGSSVCVLTNNKYWCATCYQKYLMSLSNKLKLLNKINGNGLIDLNEGEKSYSLYGPMKMAPLSNNDFKEGHVF